MSPHTITLSLDDASYGIITMRARSAQQSANEWASAELSRVVRDPPLARVSLTGKQLELFRFIVSYFGQHGISPSFEEMRDGVDLGSKSGVARLIAGLEERGAIRRWPRRERAIEIVWRAE